MKNWVQVRKKTPYRIETAISKAQNVVHVWAGTFQAKKTLGPFFKKSGWIFILEKIKRWVPVIRKRPPNE